MLIIITSLIYHYWPVILIIVPIIIILVSYFMPQLFKIFFKASIYNGRYRKKILSYANKYNIKFRDLYVIQNKRSNGAAFGLFNNKALVFTSNTLNNHPWDEIEGVIAHELGHHINKDIYIYTVVISAILIFTSMINIFVTSLFVNKILSIIISSIILSAIFLTIVLAISRWREGLADVYAKKILDRPSKLARFFERIVSNEEGNDKKVMENPSRLDKFFFTHPWIINRIKFLNS
jgi:Zn-dependent protease with chaperone function